MGRCRILACLLGLLAGCRTPAPAHVSTCDRNWVFGRKIIFARQEFVDSAVEAGQHPVQSAWTVASAPVEYARSAANGLLLKRLAINLSGRPDPVAPCRPTLDPDQLEAELRKMSSEELHHALVQLYPHGAEALAALEAMIDQATCRIDVLMYLWDNDPVGWEIAKRLAARAGPDLPVRVLVDGGGELLQGQPREAPADVVNGVECWLSHQPCVQVIRTRDPWTRFDHRKLVVVDGEIAWTGGRNFTREAFLEDHDLSLTVTGTLVHRLEETFERWWRAQGGTPYPIPDRLRALQANALARVVVTGPFEHELAHAVYRAVDQARHHIYLENPYFTDSRLQFKLVQARKRGADVRVMLTTSDVSEVINRANRVTANRLMRAGIRVYIYPRMTHVKAMSVDGRWAYLGTGNFDRLSLRQNHELGFAIGGGPLIDELEDRLFLPDFQPEWERKEPFRLRPWEYLFEAMASLFL